MKKTFVLISILFIPFFVFSQEAEITLPEVTTYVTSSVEQKIVITAEDIEAEHLESLSDVVERAGIQNLAYGPYGLENKPSIRGFTDETVRVVIDGICVNNAQYGTFDFSTINLEAVERIVIVRGGFTEGVEDEGSVGGVIYITMKKDALENSLSAEASVKTFFNSERPLDSYFQKLNFTGLLGQNTFLNAGVTANFADNLYFYEYEGEWGTRQNAQVIDGQANTYLTHYFGDGNYFSLGELFYGGYKHTPGVVNSTNPGLQQDYNNNLSFTLWNPAVANLFNLKNSLLWMCNNRFYEDSAGTENSSHYINTFKYTGTADFTSLAGGRLQQLAGLSADFTTLDSTNDGTHTQLSGVVKSTSKVALGGGWSLSVPMAAKFCANDDNVNFAFVPKAGLSWDLSYIQLICDFYRMVQFPNMDDLFWEGAGYHGNPDLKPESGWGGDIGVNLRGALAHGNLTVFSNYYKDKIQWGSGTTQNLSSAFYLGVDFSAGASFMNGFIDLDLTGEYLYNRLLDKSNKYTYGKRIMWTPDLVFTLVSSFNFELAKINLSAQYTGRRYTSNLNIYYLEAYLLVNLAVEASEISSPFSRLGFTPYLKIDNLLNWQYQSVEGYPMPGISLTLGAKVKFY